MKINLKLRFQNKVTLTAIAALVITIVYQVLAMTGVAPGIPEIEIRNVVDLIIELLALLGVVVDPTTAGINDSDRAMEYTEPKK